MVSGTFSNKIYKLHAAYGIAVSHTLFLLYKIRYVVTSPNMKRKFYKLRKKKRSYKKWIHTFWKNPHSDYNLTVGSAEDFSLSGNKQLILITDSRAAKMLRIKFLYMYVHQKILPI